MNNEIDLNTISLLKDDETIRITILTNIFRMICRRGYVEMEKYMIDGDPLNDFDNRLIEPKFAEKNETQTYIIQMDVPFVNESNKKDEFDGKQLVVKFIPQIVADIQNNVSYLDFMKQYNRFHKLLIFNEAQDKVFTLAEKKHNLEIFDKNSLMIDLMSYGCAPLRCNLIKYDKIGEELAHIGNAKVARILRNDPMAKYYGAKKGDVLRIIRRSINNGHEVAYRRVVDSKQVFR